MMAAILKDGKPKITATQTALSGDDPLPIGPDTLPSSYYAIYESVLKSSMYFNTSGNNGTNFSDGHYAQVGKALGFTTVEIEALVRANDQGVSFGTLALLIEEHPPIYSSVMTPTRRAEEAAFCENVKAAVLHHHASLHVDGGLDYLALTAWDPYTGKAAWKKKPSLSNESLMAFYKKMMAEPPKSYTTGKEVNPYEGIQYATSAFWTAPHPFLAKPSELTKLLGIWTP